MCSGALHSTIQQLNNSTIRPIDLLAPAAKQWRMPKDHWRMPKDDPHARDHDHAHGPDCDNDHGPPQEPYRRSEPKLGRNDPCHCGSGKKFKKCHGVKVAVDTPSA
jgi:uncharacterized protein YecA (UPF0149 family)